MRHGKPIGLTSWCSGFSTLHGSPSASRVSITTVQRTWHLCVSTNTPGDCHAGDAHRVLYATCRGSVRRLRAHPSLFGCHPFRHKANVEAEADSESHSPLTAWHLGVPCGSSVRVRVQSNLHRVLVMGCASQSHLYSVRLHLRPHPLVTQFRAPAAHASAPVTHQSHSCPAGCHQCGTWARPCRLGDSGAGMVADVR